jgi:hypothetical protein
MRAPHEIDGALTARDQQRCDARHRRQLWVYPGLSHKVLNDFDSGAKRAWGQWARDMRSLPHTHETNL